MNQDKADLEKLSNREIEQLWKATNTAARHNGEGGAQPIDLSDGEYYQTPEGYMVEGKRRYRKRAAIIWIPEATSSNLARERNRPNRRTT